MPVSRRSVLFGTGAALFGAALPLSHLYGRRQAPRQGIYGPLLPDPEGVLDLPPGFSYRVLQRSGATMSDGYRAPWCFDGMACFPGPPGTWVLMRNHENTYLPASGAYRHGQDVPNEAYNPNAFGGVTRLVVRQDDLGVVSSNLVLTGTVRNCSGGPSPWGWLSCEETSDVNHGYVFLCPTDRDRVAPPARVTAYGRFRHEAVCIDPATHAAYLTEDRDDACFYRFVPERRSEPFGHGRFQAMAIAGKPRFDTSSGLEVGATLAVEWVDVTTPTPAEDTLRHQARAKGAATLKRGEGVWFDGSSVLVCSTSGGPRNAGQIFRLRAADATRPEQLELLCQSTDTGVLDMPDNITVARSNDVFMAEDSVAGEHYVRVLSPDGRVSDFARNASSRSELAGVCFSPDGGTLFVNIYGDALTLAIRGPFKTA
jgi:secreted PhoX family phosphatase